MLLYIFFQKSICPEVLDCNLVYIYLVMLVSTFCYSTLKSILLNFLATLLAAPAAVSGDDDGYM